MNDINRAPVFKQSRNYLFPDLSGKRVLSVGIGGGSDCIGAYALAAYLRGKNPAATIMYGNCIRSLLKPCPGFEEDGEDAFKRSSKAPDGKLATFNMMLDLPRDEHGSPFILRIPADDARRPAAMKNAVGALKPDVVFAIDGGGLVPEPHAYKVLICCY